MEWEKLLEPDKYKDIIINSFQFQAEDKRIKLYTFVIMSNHIHLSCRQTGMADGTIDSSGACAKRFFEIFSSKNQT